MDSVMLWHVRLQVYNFSVTSKQQSSLQRLISLENRRIVVQERRFAEETALDMLIRFVSSPLKIWRTDIFCMGCPGKGIPIWGQSHPALESAEPVIEVAERDMVMDTKTSSYPIGYFIATLWRENGVYALIVRHVLQLLRVYQATSCLYLFCLIDDNV